MSRITIQPITGNAVVRAGGAVISLVGLAFLFGVV